MSSEEQAVDQLLQRAPDDIGALVRKGDLRGAAGDDRAATAFYKAALSAAAAAPALPMALKPVLERAQAGMARAARLFERHLDTSLTEKGFPAGRRPPRFQQSIEVMAGRRQASPQLQHPTSYYFPGLPERRFYERSEFAWAGDIERAAGTIRDELLHYLDAGGDDFSPYLVTDPTRPRRDVHSLVDNPDWSTLYLWEKGGVVEAHADRFRQTIAAVTALDLPHITVRAPSVLFSSLRPGAHIPPHHGMLNARLVCHLPLIVPPGCGFRVGGETRQWREGELMVFDDSVEHEAWNSGASDRIILIFDIWRPELSADERRAIVAMFEAVDAYGA